MKKTILITLLTFTLSVSAQEVAPLTLKDAITFALEPSQFAPGSG